MVKKTSQRVDDDDYDSYIEPTGDETMPTRGSNNKPLAVNKNKLNVPNTPPNAKRSSSMPAFKTNDEQSLDSDTQKALLKTFELFYEQESETMLEALEQSRDEIKNSMLDLCTEQEKYKEELVKASEGKYNFKRKKENAIPLSEYLRRKRGLPPRAVTSSPYCKY